ncbi:MAG: integration host factor subunit beta [Pyrinomonadaceae bacterium]
MFCGGSFHREAGEVETMTKAELVEDVARAAELTKKDAERLVEIVFESIIDTLNQGEKIELRGFGSFRVRERGARRGRNPKTGDPVDIPAKRVPYFKPGKELKELINEDENGAGDAVEARPIEPTEPDAQPVEPTEPDVRAESNGEAAPFESGEAEGEKTPPLM